MASVRLCNMPQLECMSCRRTPRRLYKWRWMALYPLQWRLFWGYTTFGELLLIAMAVVIAAAAAFATGHGFQVDLVRK